MNNITLNICNSLEEMSLVFATTAADISTLTDISSIGERIEHREAPVSIDKIPETIPHELQMAEDKLNEIASDELKSEFKSILNEWREISGDKDGDGIPDGWDKNPGMTVADVAAFVLKLGKYADNFHQTSATTKIASVAKSVKSLLASLNKLSEQLANLEGYKSETTRIQHMIDRISPNGIGAMDGGLFSCN